MDSTVACVIMVLTLSGFRVQCNEYEDITEQDNEEEYKNYDLAYAEEFVTSTSVSVNNNDVINNRIRRGPVEDVSNTHHPLSIHFSPNDEDKGAGFENPLTPQSINDYLPTPTKLLIEINTTSNLIETPSPTEDAAETFKTEEDTSVFKLQDDYDLRVLNWSTKCSEPTSDVDLTSSEALVDTTQSMITTSEDDDVTGMPKINVAKLLGMMSDMARQSDISDSSPQNDSILQMRFGPTSSPAVEQTVTSEYDANYTGAVIAKCFVCGLDVGGIPHNAHCADAFAGDFLPLVPVDTSAKGKITSYRKYCQYANINGYRIRPKSRAIVGRWTGGCAVRWVDLTGVYTQRVCRSRMQPTLGQHYASKRMAKLERVLWNMDNGCIASPIASLTPLSRGVSLYARFHVCVCTGSWCNLARVKAPCYWSLCTFVFTSMMST